MGESAAALGALDSMDPSAGAPTPITQLFGGVFGIAFALMRMTKWVLTFCSITVPSAVYHVLHYSLTFQLSFPFLVFCVVLVIASVVVYLRYGYWNRYERLREEPIRKNESAYLHPDVATGSTDDDRGSFHGYLDEFLQAIRIFGFLERPVFHELTRHLQTRRLVAGDVLSLDDDYSFYIVVDGHVQVFAPSGGRGRTTVPGTDAQHEYQLINEVESGGTLSSLFTILRLFTENVRLGFTYDAQDETQAGDDVSDVPPLRAQSDLPRSALSNLRMPRASPSTVLGRSRSVSSSSNVASPRFMPMESSDPAIQEHGPIPISPLLGASSPSVSSSIAAHGGSYGSPPRRRRTEDAHRPSTMARATVDTTLAVLPAEAFRRLTAKFPSAAAHIVQVILTRLARVTFHTAHQYLGLTREVMQTEESINEYAKVFLPPAFYERSAVEHLWRKFPPPKGPGELRREPSSPTDGDSRLGISPKSRVVPSRSDENLQSPRTLSHQAVAPGDLLSMVESTMDDLPIDPASQTTSRKASGVRPPDDSRDEPLDLRGEVMNCIANSIGLTQAVIQDAPSMLASPHLTSQDGGMGRGAYAGAFSGLSKLDASTMTSEDSESASVATSTHVVHAPIDRADNGVEIKHYPAGSLLARAGELNAGLFYVIDGFLDIMLPLDESSAPSEPQERGRPTSPELSRAPEPSMPMPEPSRVGNALDGTLPNVAFAPGTARASVEDAFRRSKQQEADAERFLFSVGRGGIAGYLSSLLGVPSYVDIVAKTDVYVGQLPVRALERLVEKRSNALLTLSKRLLSLLPPLILHIDAALDWQQVDAGQVIFREGDVSDSFYMVINGRLRAITQARGSESVEIVAEYSQGDSVGELDMITKSPRTKTLHSIRDSELARMPITLFNAISLWHPPITIQISRIIARRMRKEMAMHKRSALLSSPSHITGVNDAGRGTLNFKTVALLPTTQQIPILEFARRLREAFGETIGDSTVFLNQSSVMRALGRHAFSRMGKLKLAGWLANQEQHHRLVVYVVDTSVGSSWAQTSIRQADCILLVGFGDDARVGEFERLLLSIKTTARKELVLLHAERSVVPGSTREWLKARPWISAHHHVEMSGLKRPTAAPHVSPVMDPRPVQALRTLKQRLETRIGRVKTRTPTDQTRPPHFSDFARLARRLCGISIGLVLGGGGARGCAHIGVLRALEENGIPIDMVGGTSIGALVGGLYARDGAAVSSHGRAKRFAGRMASLWRFVTDVTYPLVSYTTGHEFNRGIFKCFADTHIEDMWLPFFCNTTNITWSRMEVHSSGYAWRYIRGSMTLAGLIPPLIDEGNMLVDGGYTDNLPVSIMMALGSRSVFAIDVGSIDDTSPQHFGDTLSGWWVLLNRFNPWSSMRNIPSIPDIQTRLTYTTSVKTLEEAKALDSCLYLRMPVTQYGTLEFGKYSEILQVGYDSMVDAIQKWDREGRLPTGVEAGLNVPSQHRKRRRGVSARRNSI